MRALLDSYEDIEVVGVAQDAPTLLAARRLVLPSQGRDHLAGERLDARHRRGAGHVEGELLGAAGHLGRDPHLNRLVAAGIAYATAVAAHDHAKPGQ